MNDCHKLNGKISYHDLSPQRNIFRFNNSMQVDIIPSRKLNRNDVYCHLGCFLIGCALVTNVFFMIYGLSRDQKLNKSVNFKKFSTILMGHQC